jgi:hypothetical protein
MSEGHPSQKANPLAFRLQHPSHVTVGDSGSPTCLKATDSWASSEQRVSRRLLESSCALLCPVAAPRVAFCRLAAIPVMCWQATLTPFSIVHSLQRPRHRRVADRAGAVALLSGVWRLAARLPRTACRAAREPAADAGCRQLINESGGGRSAPEARRRRCRARGAPRGRHTGVAVADARGRNVAALARIALCGRRKCLPIVWGGGYSEAANRGAG